MAHLRIPEISKRKIFISHRMARRGGQVRRGSWTSGRVGESLPTIGLFSSSSRHHFQQYAFEIFRFRHGGNDRMIVRFFGDSKESKNILLDPFLLQLISRSVSSSGRDVR